MVDPTNLSRRDFIRNITVGAGVMGSITAASTSVEAATDQSESDIIWEVPRSHKTVYRRFGGNPDESDSDLTNQDVWLQSNTNLGYKGFNHNENDAKISHKFVLVTAVNEFWPASNNRFDKPRTIVGDAKISGVSGLLHRFKAESGVNISLWRNEFENTKQEASWGGFADDRYDGGANWSDIFDSSIEPTDGKLPEDQVEELTQELSNEIENKGYSIGSAALSTIITAASFNYPYAAGAAALAQALVSGLSSDGDDCGLTEIDKDSSWKQEYHPCSDKFVFSDSILPNFQIQVDEVEVKVPADGQFHRVVFRHGWMPPSKSPYSEWDGEPSTDSGIFPPTYRDYGLYLPGRRLNATVRNEVFPDEKPIQLPDNPCGSNPWEKTSWECPDVVDKSVSMEDSLPVDGSLLNYYRSKNKPNDVLNPSDVLDSKDDYLTGDLSLEETVKIQRSYFF
ncbi:twin-arginine translocation signal domain-containing protein [Halococcoides cellulosivorans]|uniref:Uncharacterized protein n=1 Tax=Halococcoides cellulosivorans TaxID=1679096 RepID=A0A2R4X0N5_9EURY|nr:twin-arginine translocation signal domain-containing protein [Halococcoides cellulosivorans]AWB27354.1 hypothetical protein HARCEL1_06385 [Halococcoides cellulosivorans]